MINQINLKKIFFKELDLLCENWYEHDSSMGIVSLGSPWNLGTYDLHQQTEHVPGSGCCHSK